jgi:hypothetical protein
MSAKAKYEIVAVNDVEITVDVSLLLKSEELYFNATDIAKQFGKRPNDFLVLTSTQEYIAEILKESHYGNSGSENLVRVTNGGRYKGTWLHQELAYEFAGWLSPTFRRNLHKWVDSRLKEEHRRKQYRLELKTGYLPLTDAIQAAHEKDESHNYSNEANLINKLVTGMTAKKFKVTYNVKNVRDALTAAQARLMNKVQRHNSVLIEMGVDYHEGKRLLQQVVDRAA